MLKCITLDGDVSTLNDLMEYLEKIDRTLAEVNELLANKRAEQAVYLREGSKIVRLNQEDILYLEGYGGDYVKVHRIEGKPILSQVSLKRFEECRKRIRIEGTLIPVSDSYLPMLMSRLRIQI